MKNFKFQISNFKLRTGQSLVEVVLAVAVAIIVIASLVSLAAFAMRISRSSLQRSMAEKLALGGLEAVRITKDKSSGGYNFFSSAGNYYMVKASGLETCSGLTCDSTNLTVYCNQTDFGRYFDTISAGTNTFFCRKIKVSSDQTTVSGVHYRDIKVEVRWKEGSGERVTNIATRIFR